MKLFHDPVRVLREYSRTLCLSLALVVGLILSLHAVFAEITPVADGEGYAIRGCALYGFLHAGEWRSFWELLDSPNQSICPPHYLLFFMVPQAFAGVGSYIIAQGLTTYLVLAYGIYKLCQALRRAEWAPAIVLLCGVSNVAMNDVYLFYLDMEFFAVGVVAIAWQVTAWGGRGTRSSVLSGLMLGVLFWVKPANAVIFLATFLISELFHAMYLVMVESKAGRRHVLRGLLQHWGSLALGFIPVVVLALVCGGLQSILQLIHNSEVYQATTPLAGGLLRFIYFPLCLSFFYHVVALGVLLVVAFWASRWMGVAGGPKNESFPAHLFVPIALAYLIFGEFFSFWMLQKLMRSLLLMLPLSWILFYWWGEKRRLRVDVMFLAVCLYAALAFSQKTFDLLGTRSPTVEDTYQLSSGSWTRMPSPWTPGISVNRGLCNSVKQDPPPGRVICVNSIELQKLMTWVLDIDDVLAGKRPPYEVRNLFNYKAEYYNRSLVGASLVILKTAAAVQSSEPVRVESLAMANYFAQKWAVDKEGGQAISLMAQGKEPLGYELLFLRPLTEEQVMAANRIEPFSDMQQVEENGGGTFSGAHFSRAEAWELLKAWYEKRVGGSH